MNRLALLLLAPTLLYCKSSSPKGEEPQSPAASSQPATPKKAPPAPSAPSAKAPSGSMHAAFDAILKANVKNERVDYNAIKASHQPALKTYLDALAAVDVAKLPTKEQLALYINLYNATMIQSVLDHRAKDAAWKPSASDFGVFKENSVRLKTGAISLNDLENKVIRPTFKEPRIHVALVCGARSCPPLIPRAYEASDLEQVLEANMKAFITGGDRNKVDEAKKALTLSRIFDWYKDDFGGADGVPKYINKYTAKDTSAYKVGFSEYSWELNNLN